MKTKILLLPAALILVVNMLNAQRGKIDSSFGTNGHTLVNAEGYYQYNFTYCSALAINSKTGKILFGAHSRSTVSGDKYYQNLVQLKTNGKIDTKYAVNGVVSYDPGFAINYTNDGFRCLTLQDDGKAVFVSNFDQNNPPTIFISRFNKDGTIDGSFGTYGNVEIVNINSNTMAEVKATDIAMQPDGKILIAGNYTNSVSFPNEAMILWRLKSNGSFDSSFGANGTLDLRNYISGWNSSVNKILVQDDGKILLGGASNYYFGNPQFTLFRLLSNGAADASFGKVMAGYVYENFHGTTNNYCTALALQPDGKIVAGGNNYSSHGTQSWCFMRFNKNGNLDKNFNSSGKLLLDSLVEGPVKSMAVGSNGKIVAAGWATYYHNTTLYYNLGTILQLKDNGKVDNSFGLDGVVSDSMALGFTGMAIDADGNIVVGGNSFFNGTTVMLAARYRTNLSLNMSKDAVAYSKTNASAANITTPLVYPNPIQSNAVLTYTIDKDELVSIFLYDINGKLVQTITSNNKMVAGIYKQDIHFESSVLPGNYILSIQTATRKASIKLIKQ